jgi:carboxypeptidase Q
MPSLNRLKPPSLRNGGLACLAGLLCVNLQLGAQSNLPAPAALSAAHRDIAGQLLRAATNSSAGYARLQELCDTFGPRHTGSTNLEAAIDWALQQFTRQGFQNVRGEPVTLPAWARGSESVTLLSPRFEPLPMLGLGNSMGTPPQGITAPVLVVTNFQQLTTRSVDARGKIVLFAVPYTSYGQVVAVRTRGASEAARAGAVASLIRSLTPSSLRTPHTGMMSYAPDAPKIPAAALSTEDADMLLRMQERGQAPVVRLQMEAHSLGDIRTRNVVAELPGTSSPDEIVLGSGHFDSWDVGQGAQDDAAGSMVAWEAVRLIHELGLKHRRTLRVVLWANEEYGVHGAPAYVKAHAAELPKHVLAMESDTGIFQPVGFRFTGSDAAAAVVRAITELLEPVGATRMTLGGADADISKLLAEGVPCASLATDNQRYFHYHHSAADTVDKVDRAEFQRCVGAVAVLLYLAADLPDPLPR